MKRLLLSLLIACCMSASPLFARTTAQIVGIQNLIRNLENNAVSANDVWDEIKKLKINPYDYRDPEYKRMNQLAIDLLNKSDFTINNKRITLDTNLGALPASSKPMKVMARGEVSEEPSVVGAKPKPRRSDREMVPLEEEEEEMSPEMRELFKTPEEKAAEEEAAYRQGFAMFEPEIPTSKLTLAEALRELKELEEDANQVEDLSVIREIYKNFYKLQDTYFGLSDAKVTGRLWWKKETENDKRTFAEASAKTLKAILDKDLALRGETTVKLTPDEAKAFVAEVNATNPFEAFKNKPKKEKEALYKDILDARNNLFRWKKIQQSGRPLTRDDLDEIKKAVQKAGSMDQYMGEFTRKIGRELQEYLKSPKVLEQTKLLTTETAKLDEIKQALDTLSQEIIKAIDTVSKNKLNGDITSIDFATKFTKINGMIAKLADKDKSLAQPLADQTFALFGKYVGLAQSAQSNLWTTYWAKSTQQAAVALDTSDAKVAALRKDYYTFPSYINAPTKDDSDTLKKTITAASKETRMALAESMMIELRDKILIMQRDLARGFRMVVRTTVKAKTGETPEAISRAIKEGRREETVEEKVVGGTYALDNFARYQNFFGELLNPFVKLLDDNDTAKVKTAWNALQNMYAQYLKNVIIQYREDTDLAHLHELATGETVKIAEGVGNMLPEAPFNAIGQMLTDLNTYLNSSDGQAIKAEITKEVIENLCYMCAAFDGFSYALLTGTLQQDNITKAQRIKSAVTWLYSGFWGILRYKVEATKDAFQKQNESLVNEFLTAIINALTLYNSRILSKLQDSQDVKAYNSNPGALNIMVALGKEKLEKAKLYSKEAALEGAYRYGLVVPSRIVLAGGTVVENVSTDNITPVHKKEYGRITNLYTSILEKAYGDPKWEEKAKARSLFQEMQNLTQEYKQRTDQFKAEISQLQKQKETVKTIAKIFEINQKIKNTEDLYKKIVDTMQKGFEKAIETTGIYNQ